MTRMVVVMMVMIIMIVMIPIVRMPVPIPWIIEPRSVMIWIVERRMIVRIMITVIIWMVPIPVIKHAQRRSVKKPSIVKPRIIILDNNINDIVIFVHLVHLCLSQISCSHPLKVL